MQEILQKLSDAVKRGQDAFGTFAKSLDQNAWLAIAIVAVLLILLLIIIGAARRKSGLLRRIEALESIIAANPPAYGRVAPEMAPVPWSCAACNASNEADALFCKQCGTKHRD